MTRWQVTGGGVSRQRLGRGRGFTLLELLVVMTLLSLLMTGLISAMRTMAQTETRIDQHLQRLDDLRTVRAFLSQALSQVSSVQTDTPGIAGKASVPFIATPNSITWVGALPARPGAGGRHYFKLALEEQVLVLRLLPCGPDLKLPDWVAAEVHLLVPNVSRFTVQAQGSPVRGMATNKAWPQGWQTGWPIVDELPERVNLTLADSAQDEMASWTFVLHPFLRSDATISSVTVGGATP